MDNLKLTEGIINLLQYLLPGFLAAWVFYGFTSFPKPSQFERIVQALVFTLIIQAIVFIERFVFLSIGNISSRSLGLWSSRSELFCSAITAIFIGFLFTYFANTDKFHAWVRKHKNYGGQITRETSYPSEWFATFAKSENETYVVLNFVDDRRLWGWVIEWPSEPVKGHFVLVQAAWLDREEMIPLAGVSSIMINVKDVKWVEFIDLKSMEVSNGEEKSVTT